MKISLFKDTTDTDPVLAERSWDQIVSKIKRPPIRREKDGALWSPATFDPPKRLKQNVSEVSLLVGDYDHNADFESDLQPWRPYTFAAHTTFNHSETEQRFRVTIPLKDPIPATDFPRLWKWASQMSGGKIDSSASDSSRMYYPPGRRAEDGPYLFEIHEAELLDWRALDLPPVEERTQAPPAPANEHSRDVDELLRKAFAAKNGAETFRLFEGDTSLFAGDESRADYSLASRLAFFAGDQFTLEQMMLRSRLARKKWSEQHYGDGRTYLQGVIEKAIASCSEFYSGNGHSPTHDNDPPAKTDKETSNRFKLTAVDDLIAEPKETLAYVVAGLLACACFSILAAKPKVGKSTFARALAVAVAMGWEFFGRTVKQGVVIYLCLEEKRAEVADHFRRMGANGSNLIIHTGATPKDALIALDLAIEEHSPVLVIIDPLSRFVRVTDFNSYAETTRALEPLIDLARLSHCGTHILSLHHNGKSGDLRDPGDAVMGSTGFFGAVDALLTMRKRERSRTIESTQRYGTDLVETIVHLDPVTGLVEPAGDMHEFSLNERKKAVLEVVSNDPLAESAIKELVGSTNAGLTAKALRMLCDEGIISRTGLGKKNAPFLYFLRRVEPDFPDEIYIPAGASDAQIEEILRA